MSFLEHPLLIWEWFVLAIGFGVIRVGLIMIWRKGKKKGVSEYDDYKKWETRFKDEGKLK